MRGSRLVVCPAKAGVFSRSQSCRGKSQSPVAWIAEFRETKALESIDKIHPWDDSKSPGRSVSERIGGLESV